MVNAPGDFSDEPEPARPASPKLHVPAEAPIYEMMGPIPTREQIMGILLQHAPHCTVARELSDHDGIYLIEATIPGENPGEITEYRFERKGVYGQNQFSATSITIVYYDADGVPEGGKTVASYDEKTGIWLIQGR